MRRIEGVAAVTGLAILALAGLEVFRGRPYELLLVAGVALLVIGVFGRRLRTFKIGGPGGIGMTIEQAAEVTEQALSEDQAEDLKLTVGHLYPMGDAEMLMGSTHAVGISAVNTGDKPIGIHTLGLELSSGQWTPFLRQAPFKGNVEIPGVLRPQESASVYHDYNGLVRSIQESGARVTGIVATLADGTRRRVDAPAGWETLEED